MKTEVRITINSDSKDLELYSLLPFIFILNSKLIVLFGCRNIRSLVLLMLRESYLHRLRRSMFKRECSFLDLFRMNKLVLSAK